MFSVKSGNPLSLIMSVPNNFSTYSREATVQLFTFHLHIKQSRTFLITNLSNIKTKIFFKKSNASNVFTFLFCLFHLIDTFFGVPCLEQSVLAISEISAKQNLEN